MMSTDAPECTKEAATIQAIDKGSVHRICSGQVVLTLATAVKELVENSIDAGATSVDVKLKDYGSELIEVTDNGDGVQEVNFEALTLKHHTSKLQDFEDLINVSTFGFRGEALSSLCALSDMVITTRHKSVDIGTRLELDLNGKIVSKKATPRQVGTTVLIQNIFYTLPVRHKEFARNLKKEFARLVQVLNAYCIVNTGVRITCTNQQAKGNRSTVVSTKGNVSIKENIANVFGAKQLNSLLEFSQSDVDETVCADYGLKAQQLGGDSFRLEGFVSKCEHGQGRSSSDRQFIFINKRPCDALKIMKVVNEVYHSYNRHQNPFVCLNIEMKKDSVDVNVTPDKRQIFVEGERHLLAVIKSSLIRMFEPTSSVYKINNVLLPPSPFLTKTDDSKAVNKSSPSNLLSTLSRSNSLLNTTSHSDIQEPTDSLSKLKRSFSSAFSRNDSPVTKHHSDSNKKSRTPFMSRTLNQSSSSTSERSITKFLSKLQSPERICTKTEENCNSPILTTQVQDAVILVDVEPSCTSNGDSLLGNGTIQNNPSNMRQVSSEHADESTCELKGEYTDPVTVQKTLSCGNESKNNNNIDSHRSESPTLICESYSKDKIYNHNSEAPTLGYENEAECRDNTDSYSPGSPEVNHQVKLITLDEQEEDSGSSRKERRVHFSMSHLRNKLKRDKGKPSEQTIQINFRAKISPGENKSAEEELSKEISKEMFTKMKILGQFNLGFIIVQLGEDLFIVDQHATDEKYNFEMLQRHTVLHSQKLILPQCMELTASNETILMDNLDVFKKNGFDFVINPDDPPTQRVKLVSAPASKNWNFGKEDIEELIFMLTDSPNVMCRPTRIRMMFASRACRKSVMIGTSLKQSEMRRIMSHMADIDQPWSCPHGRPTMRHLFNMNMLPS